MSEIRISDKVLSRIVDRVARKVKENPDISKSTMLNIAAGEIVGPGHDWGMIKNTKETVVSRDLRNTKVPRLEYGAIGMHAGTIPESLVTTMPLVRKEDPLGAFFRKTEKLIDKEARREESINFIPLLLEELILDFPDLPQAKYWQYIVDNSKNFPVNSDDDECFKLIADWLRESVIPEAMILALSVGIGKEWSDLIEIGHYRNIMIVQGKLWEIWNPHQPVKNVYILKRVLEILIAISEYYGPKNKKQITRRISMRVGGVAWRILDMHDTGAVEDYFSKINIEGLAEKILQQSRV